ncbi:glycosyltransferase 87 family protein [Frankia sp. AgB32]|uniref:glycosyltransferase 87 family protein n=1 Tax=Frankia sp. AgB32 TaxID=631119 RepID=UPI00200D05A4|nr:glycosyltransferase 87 family protein [Frankia sp. AgB32]MCK9896504.1 glycosyltransferase 87 family protein [Frankia sp. AgB32]
MPTGRFALATLGLAGVVALAWFGMIIQIGHFDVDVFLRAGRAVRDGRSPYPAPGTAAVYSGSAFVYPYLTAWPFAVLSRLPDADTVFVAGSVLAVLAGVRLTGARDWRVYALVVTASATIIGLQMGTLNAWLFAALALAWRRRDHPGSAGAAVALAIYSKVFLAPVLLWLVLARRWRAAAVALALLAVLLGVGELVSPLGTASYLTMLGQLGRAEALAGVSLTGLLANVGLPMGGANALARGAALAVLAGCALALRRGHDERLAFTGAVVAGLLASPVVWCHYLLVLVAPLLALSAPADRDGAPTRADGVPTRAVGRPSPVPIAVFATATWFLATPHRSTAAGLAVTAAIGTPLVLSCLLAPGVRGAFAGPRRPTVPKVTLVASLTAVAVALGDIATMLATVHTPSAHVVGSYLVFVGVLALLAWAVRTTATRSTTERDGHGPASPRPTNSHGLPSTEDHAVAPRGVVAP